MRGMDDVPVYALGVWGWGGWGFAWVWCAPLRTRMHTRECECLHPSSTTTSAYRGGYIDRVLNFERVGGAARVCSPRKWDLYSRTRGSTNTSASPFDTCVL
jgi:hypothetical protein